jgi:hypothetical protein
MPDACVLTHAPVGIDREVEAMNVPAFTSVGG